MRQIIRSLASVCHRTYSCNFE